MNGNSPRSPESSSSDSHEEEDTESYIPPTITQNDNVNRSISSLLAAREDEFQAFQRRQWLLQQQLAQQQSRDDAIYQNQIRALLETQQTASLQNLYGELSANSGVPPLGMDRSLGGLFPQNNDAVSISALLQSIQRQNFEQEQLLRRQQHHNLMSNASLDLYDPQRRMNIAQLASDLTAASSSMPSLSNYNTNPQHSLFPYTASRPDLLGSSQALPDRSSTFNPNLREQLLQEFVRSQQMEQQQQQQQQQQDLSGRLALLLQQRQDLQASFPLASQNIAVQEDSSMNPTAAAKASSGKIFKSIDTSFESNFAPKPKRPLSAYNIFFQEERQKLLKSPEDDAEGKDADDRKPAALSSPPPEPLFKGGGSKKRKRGKPHHKVSFEEMAKIIGQRWKDLQEKDEARKMYYQDLAQSDKERYRAELLVWKKQRSSLISQQRKKMEDDEQEVPGDDV